jgi:hypothetical protein
MSALKDLLSIGLYATDGSRKYYAPSQQQIDDANQEYNDLLAKIATQEDIISQTSTIIAAIPAPEGEILEAKDEAIQSIITLIAPTVAKINQKSIARD